MLEFATGPGFFQVLHDRAIALVDDAVEASQIDDDRARAQLEAAQAELEAIERGDSTADRWQVEQRIKHAENQLDGRRALSARARGPAGGRRVQTGPPWRSARAAPDGRRASG